MISIGDVGYLNNDGAFIRIFDATLPWDDPSNRLLGRLEEYEPLNAGRPDIVRDRTAFDPIVYRTHHVSEVVDNVYANTYEE